MRRSKSRRDSKRSKTRRLKSRGKRSSRKLSSRSKKGGWGGAKTSEHNKTSFFPSLLSGGWGGDPVLSP